MATPSETSVAAHSLRELVASRRDWIQATLRPWCRQASAAELRLAEGDWVNLAGSVDPGVTLWIWAWERFPGLIHPDFQRLDETRAVTVRLHSGESLVGFPDGRRGLAAGLWIVPATTESEPPASAVQAASSRRISVLGPLTLQDVAEVVCELPATLAPPPRPVTPIEL